MAGRRPLEPPEGNDEDADAPSELLAPLLDEWRDVLAKHVLARLDPTDCAMLARVGKPWLAVVVANNLTRAGKVGAVPLNLVNFIGSVERLAWAKDNGCPWEVETCRYTAEGGHLAVLQWAREHGCPWDVDTCARVAARGGHLDVLKWVALEHDCQLDVHTPAWAAAGGHLEMLQWAWEHNCPWDWMTCNAAVKGGHLDVLRWAREHGCPWISGVRDAAAAKGYSDNLPLSV